MNLEILIGAKAADKIQKSGINILQACEIEIQYIAGKAAAKKITAAKEMLNIVHDRLQIKCSIDIYEIVKDMQFLDHERFEVLALNRNNKVIERIIISQGGISSTVVDLKILFKRVLICGASSFICVHNHPSGNLDASQADIDLTRKINAAANVLDLKLLDHIIVAGNNYTSFADNGMM
jgi:DNA repair protein RadC